MLPGSIADVLIVLMYERRTRSATSNETYSALIIRHGRHKKYYASEFPLFPDREQSARITIFKTGLGEIAVCCGEVDGHSVRPDRGGEA
jgi:hypothetical protein